MGGVLLDGGKHLGFGVRGNHQHPAVYPDDVDVITVQFAQDPEARDRCHS